MLLQVTLTNVIVMPWVATSDQLQVILNAVACLITYKQKCNHIT